MFSLMRYIYRWAVTKPQRNIGIFGLQESGKTCTLNDFKRAAKREVTAAAMGPTIGFNTFSMVHSGIKFDFWDVGGQRNYRDTWRYYFTDVDAFLYVVDSSDPSRLEESSAVLAHMLKSPALTHAVVVVCANKQDLPGALKPEELKVQLKLETLLANHAYTVIGTSTGNDLPLESHYGTGEILNWVANVFKTHPKAQRRLEWREEQGGKGSATAESPMGDLPPLSSIGGSPVGERARPADTPIPQAVV